MLAESRPPRLILAHVLLGATWALSLAGCADGDSHASDDLVESDPVSQQLAGLTGNWGLFVFDEPVAVRLEREGDELTGSGCCIPDAAAEAFCCGRVTGSVQGAKVSFSFPLASSQEIYRADVVLSEDGTRMGGEFFHDVADSAASPPAVKSAWLHYDGYERNWLDRNPDLASELSALENPTVRLSPTSSEGDGFEYDTDYHLVTSRDGLGGDLGPFWGTEISVRPSDGALVAGPVPATDPLLPVSLVLRRDGTKLVDVDATLASGASYQFNVVPDGER